MFSSTLQRALLIAALTLCVATAALAQGANERERSLAAPLASRSLLLDVARADGILVAVGERGHILVSTDAGVNWRQADTPTRSTLTGVHFHDRNLGWAVGHDAVILRTADGGQTWQRVHWAPQDETPFLDVWFADARKGFAIGAYGRCYVTEDGGGSWTEKPVSEGDDFHLNQIARAADGRTYIAAESGQVYRSDDDGESWKALDTGYAGSLFGVLPLEGDVVLLFGLRGHLLRSEDAGETWVELSTGTTAMLNSGLRLEDGSVVVAGLAGTLLVSRDGGRTFTVRQQASRAGIQSLIDAGGGQLIVVGEFGVKRVPVAELSGTAARVQP
ncbi:MAG: WD40/YVTN/BNR-like repeat-containing protein [Thermoanaerobaculia bacterium]